MKVESHHNPLIHVYEIHYIVKLFHRYRTFLIILDLPLPSSSRSSCSVVETWQCYLLTLIESICILNSTADPKCERQICGMKVKNRKVLQSCVLTIFSYLNRIWAYAITRLQLSSDTLSLKRDFIIRIGHWRTTLVKTIVVISNKLVISHRLDFHISCNWGFVSIFLGLLKSLDS